MKFIEIEGYFPTSVTSNKAANLEITLERDQINTEKIIPT